MADSSTAAEGIGGGSTANTANAKIVKDLCILREKMDLCDSMLNPGADSPTLSVNSSEAMMAVVGFLEACAPRMLELVEAAASGALSESVFEEVLQCNDRLQKLLTDVETAALTETSASTTAASALASTGSVGAQFDDLLLTDDEMGKAPSPVPAVTAGLKSTGEEDEEESKPPAVQQSSSTDEFDAFFATRQGT